MINFNIFSVCGLLTFLIPNIGMPKKEKELYTSLQKIEKDQLFKNKTDIK